MTNEIQIFTNPEFGNVRTLTDDDFGDFFGFDADGYYDDITEKEEF